VKVQKLVAPLGISAVAIAMQGGRSTKDVGGDLGTAATGRAIAEILRSEMATESAAARHAFEPFDPTKTDIGEVRRRRE